MSVCLCLSSLHRLSTLTNETLTSLYDLFDDDGVSDLYKVIKYLPVQLWRPYGSVVVIIILLCRILP